MCCLFFVSYSSRVRYMAQSSESTKDKEPTSNPMPPPAPPACEGEEDNRDIPPAFSKDLTLREMKASFKSNKGAMTRLSNQVKVRVETFIAIKSSGSETQLNESYNK